MNTSSSSSSITFSSMIHALDGIKLEAVYHKVLMDSIDYCPICGQFFQKKGELQTKHTEGHLGKVVMMDLLKNLERDAHILLQSRARIYIMEAIIAHSELGQAENDFYRKIREEIDAALFFS